LAKKNKRLFRTVIVTDFGAHEIPPNVEKRYMQAYYRRRAPKKSAREAMDALERDVKAMVHYCWLMDKEGINW
jgi:hypothetical protein